ncbi:Calcium ion binding protein isoform 1 [Dorcoceras hygrometricum]|uniref:Calcium ion binding protein isoform 1 n=1 Tax=Dorcoceras hygrometricum TaxID=472368 RepID=A0A2Z7A1K7_9LAMI|nr:Calcium ion binding protein isoform 1 [Dorcoceras hygrometricum]
MISLTKPCHHPSLPSSFQKLDYPLKPNYQIPSNAHPTRRSILLNILITTPTSIILAKSATALELRFTVPDQTLEEAENIIPIHAQSLLKVKDLLMVEAWVEAQKALRKSSSYLKQDLYTIIQGKPAKERPQLRKLYAALFNAVTMLDYAARDEDRVLVWDYWSTICSSLDLILSKI